MRGGSCRDYRFAPDQPICRRTMLSGLVEMTAPLTTCISRSVYASSRPDSYKVSMYAFV
jgi:hypothetical protein